MENDYNHPADVTVASTACSTVGLPTLRASLDEERCMQTFRACVCVTSLLSSTSTCRFALICMQPAMQYWIVGLLLILHGTVAEFLLPCNTGVFMFATQGEKLHARRLLLLPHARACSRPAPPADTTTSPYGVLPLQLDM